MSKGGHMTTKIFKSLFKTLVASFLVFTLVSPAMAAGWATPTTSALGGTSLDFTSAGSSAGVATAFDVNLSKTSYEAVNLKVVAFTVDIQNDSASSASLFLNLLDGTNVVATSAAVTLAPNFFGPVTFTITSTQPVVVASGAAADITVTTATYAALKFAVQTTSSASVTITKLDKVNVFTARQSVSVAFPTFAVGFYNKVDTGTYAFELANPAVAYNTKVSAVHNQLRQGLRLVDYTVNGVSVAATGLVKADATYFANWVTPTFTITTNPVATGAASLSLIGKVGQAISIPEPTYPGLFFTGWEFKVTNYKVTSGATGTGASVVLSTADLATMPDFAYLILNGDGTPSLALATQGVTLTALWSATAPVEPEAPVEDDDDEEEETPPTSDPATASGLISLLGLAMLAVGKKRKVVIK